MSIHAEKLIKFSQEQNKKQWAFMKKILVINSFMLLISMGIFIYVCVR